MQMYVALRCYLRATLDLYDVFTLRDYNLSSLLF